MKPIFYIALTVSVLSFKTSDACRPAPTLFELMLRADVISQLSFAVKDSVPYEYKTYDGKVITSAKYRLLINEKTNYKGILPKNEILVSKWAVKYFENEKEGLFLMNIDTAGNLILRNYFLGKEPSVFNTYELSELQFANLCEKTNSLQLDYTVPTFEKLSQAVVEVATLENHFALFNYLDRTEYAITDFSDSIIFDNYLKEAHLEKINHFFTEATLKSDLVVRVADEQDFKNLEEVLANHLNTYYCTTLSDDSVYYDEYYARNLEYVLLARANSSAKKQLVAAFVKKRMSISRSEYFGVEEIALFDTLYPSLNVLSLFEELTNSSVGYSERRVMIKNILAQISTYRPSEKEPKLSNNFCTTDRAEMPKLEFDVAPNPTDAVLNLRFKNINPDEEIFIELIGLSGNVVYRNAINPYATFFNKEMNFGHLPAGMYQLRIFNKFSLGTETLQIL